MRVALIGAGVIADAHGPAIRAFEGAKIVAVCDTNAIRAEQLAKALEADDFFTDAETMFAECRPDVVHILTPPATHLQLAEMAADHGCHVLVEKPLALSAADVESMLATAKKNNVKICVGHNMVFDSLTQKALEAIRDGKIGNVVSVEAHYRFDSNRYPAARADGAQFTHWLYELNGGPLQDLIPHPISLMFEFLDEFDDVEVVSSEGSILPEGWPEEVRVLVKSSNRFGFVTVSLHEKPATVTLSVNGDDGTVSVDYFSGIVTMQRSSFLPRAAQRLLLGLRKSWQNFAGSVGNVLKVLIGRFDTSGGTTEMVRRFYEAIQGKGPDPISHDKMLNSVRLIDAIWPEPSRGLLKAQEALRTSRKNVKSKPATALVTGASGFIGSHILKRLAEEGIAARALVRPNSINAGRLVGSGVEVFTADLADSEAMMKACEGIDTIYHAGASTDNQWQSNELATITGTRNVLEAAKQHGARKIVHLSTLAVYELLDKPKNALITEDSPFHNNPRKMGAYSYCKIEAEKLIGEYTESSDLDITILRPGMVIGEGCYPFFPHFGFNLGEKLFLTIGKGDVVLPFTCVEHVVDAMHRAATNDVAAGRVYNIVDDAAVTARHYIERFIEVTGVNARVAGLPYFIPYLAFGTYELVSAVGLLPKGITSRDQLKWKQSRVTYDTSRAKNDLGWQPFVDIEDAMEATFKAHARKYY
jgi:predicted dehydrogenase/nucleoside-diphosphate-sugar epimerase